MPYYRDDIAVLPTKTKVEFTVACVVGPYVEEGQTGYVIEGHGGKRRYLTAFGNDGWGLGQCFGLKHDQSSAQLGYYEVIGIYNHRTGERRGQVPTEKKLVHWVVK